MSETIKISTNGNRKLQTGKLSTVGCQFNIRTLWDLTLFIILNILDN